MQMASRVPTIADQSEPKDVVLLVCWFDKHFNQDYVQYHSFH